MIIFVVLQQFLIALPRLNKAFQALLFQTLSFALLRLSLRNAHVKERKKRAAGF